MDRILVVEDSPTQAERLRLILEGSGYVSEVAVDAEKALERLGSSSFDMVISDIVMPGLSGVEVLQAIQTIAPRVKVIMVSGGATPEQRMRSLALGAFDFVRKPVDTAYLLRSIDVAVGMKQLESR